MDPITNLVVNEISLVDGNTSIDFMFDKPSGVVGGYYLYTSSTGVVIIPGPESWAISGNLNEAKYSLSGSGLQDATLSFGGDSTAISGTTEKFNGSTWTTDSGWNLTLSRKRLAGCGIQNASLSFGGRSAVSLRVDYSESFNGSSWSATNLLNAAKELLAGAGIQSAGLSFGGYNGSYLATTEKFDGSIWTYNAAWNLNTARYKLAGAGIQSAALAFGGEDSISYTGITEKFDGSTWSTTGSLNLARGYFAGCGLQSSALSFGGYNGAYTAITEKFNGSTWSTTSNLNNSPSEQGGSGLQSAALCFGGDNNSSPYTVNTEKFNRNDYYDYSSFEYLDARVDASHRKSSDISTWDDFYGKTHYYYTFDDPLYQGKVLYFYITAVSTLLIESTYSSITSTGTYPQQPDNLFCIYDNYESDLSWDSLQTSSGRNSDFNRFDIYINNLDEVSGTTMTYDVLYNSSFTEGKAVWIIDIFKRNQWFGEVTSTGALDLALIKRDQYSSLTDSPFLDNFKIYVESSSDTFVGSTTSTGLVDTSFVKGYHSIYKLKSVTSTGLSSEFSKFPVYLVDVSNTLPYLRSPVNSSTGLLNNIYWEQIKNTLIDKNYYDKSLYAIPYSATETFNLKGFLGVSRCLVDVFINDIYGFTTSTGIYGEYNINYKFEKGQTDLRIQARDRENIAFSRTTGTYSIRTIYIYTWYSVLGNQYAQIADELGYLRTDNSLATVRYSSYTDRYKPLIELSKYAEEDSTEFLTLAANVFKMFEYVSYDESINILFDSIQTEADYFDHYDVFYRNSLYRTIKTGWNFVTISTSTGLDRGNYYYGVTSLTSTGEETGAEVIRVDDRWWPLSSTGFVRMNVIQWSPVNGIPYYNIYRGISEDSLEYLTTISGLLFIDAGAITPNPLKVPPIHNFTDYEAPIDLSLYLDTRLAPYEMFLKNKTWIQIVIYAEDNNDIPEFQLERIMFYLKKIIAPEIRYTVIYANDSSVRFLT